uniref:Putative helicase n=1 Tax=viral metagenome TaxID=1070528 RepID=A0A6M3IPZ6_9ZZZZ
MQVETFDGSQERSILIAMIMNDSVLSRISAKYERGMFESVWARIISGWCVEYHEKYNHAPKKTVQGLFDVWAEKHKSKEAIELVSDFLGTLSDEYESGEEINSDYVIDVAGEYFNRVRALRLSEKIQGDIDSGNTSKAIERIEAFGRIEIGAGSGIDVFHDQAAIRDVFAEKKESIIKYPGALGVFFDDMLERDGFVSFMGPEGCGKTWWLIDMAFRAMLQRRRVAFFEVGDMSQRQVIGRLLTRASRHPKRACTVQYPTEIFKDSSKEMATVTFKEKVFDRPLSWQKARKSCEEMLRKRVKTSRSLFKLSCHPNSTMNVQGIKAILQSWQREDWVPDVICIDYADILLADAPSFDFRNQINDTWKRLRSLSQEWHCLVVTNTQADAKSYSAQLLDRANFSDDKRKNAHVTASIGINVSSQEKEAGITRLNLTKVREGYFSSKQCVHVAGCLALGNPAVRSCL